MKRVAIGFLIAALGTPLTADAAELVAAEKCDDACAAAFGRHPAAVCRITMTRVALGETTTRHESVYANYKNESGAWAFDVRSFAERSTLKLSAGEFNEVTGVMRFTYRNTSIVGICKRFHGQNLPRVAVERHPLMSPEMNTIGMPIAPGALRWGQWQWIPSFLGGGV